jgi:PKD repeat protein
VNGDLVPSCGVLWGAVANAFNKRPSWPAQGPEAHRRFESETGRTVGLYAYYFKGSNGALWPRSSEIGLAREQGKRRLLYMHWKPGDDMSFADVAAGRADRRIDRQAAYLKANFTEKVFVALNHEMEPEVNPAAGSGRTAADFAAMHRHVHDRFAAQGVDNIVWVVTYMGFPRWVTQPWFDQLYPGDAYTDWVAWDPYSATDNGYRDYGGLLNTTSGSRDPAFTGMYNKLTKLHPGKPLMLSEFGVFHTPGKPGAVATRKADFYDSVAAQLDRYPAIKALVKFDTEYDDFNNNGYDISTFNNPTNLAAFKRLSANPGLVNPDLSGGGGGGGGGNTAPVARFAATAAGLTVSVDGRGSTDADGRVVAYAWDFGDGTRATGAQPPAHTYARGGDYRITLTVTDDKGATGTNTKTTTVVDPNQAPVARFSVAANGLAVSVNGLGSSDADGRVVKYAWNFGDGSTGEGPTASHTYARGGDYRITLTVTDDKGATGTNTKTTTVVQPNRPPVAQFSAAIQDLTVRVDGGKSTDPDGQVASYEWNFGDGTTGRGVREQHSYAKPGSYTVTLTVTDDDGARARAQQTVAATQPPIVYVGASTVNGNVRTVSLPLPSGSRTGDTVVLSLGAPIDITGIRFGGAGTWSPVGRFDLGNLTMAAYAATLRQQDLAQDVTVTLPAYGKVDIQLHGYRGPPAGVSVGGFTAAASLRPTLLTSPSPRATVVGTWAMYAWYARSANVQSMVAPNGVAVRGSGSGSGGGHITSLIADSGSAVPLGPVAPRTAVPDAVPAVGGSYSVLLTPR